MPIKNRIASLEKRASSNHNSLSPTFVMENGEPVSASMPVYGLGDIIRDDHETPEAFEHRMHLLISRASSAGHVSLAQLSDETLERCLTAKNAELKTQYGIEFTLGPQYEWEAVRGPDFSIHREEGEAASSFLARVEAQLEEHNL